MGDRRGKIPKSIVARASRLFFSGAKIAAREVANRLISEDSKLANRIRQTEELVATLSQLKGAAMKAGQLISLEFSDMLPPEILAILRQLHDSSTFMPFDQVRYILNRELGAEKFSSLEELTPEPIAAASIGQVHKAVLNGRPVAVKIQYPGVSKSIDSDLAVIRRIVNLGIQMRGKTVDMEPIFTEIASGLKREADYQIEAANVEVYRKALAGSKYIVPSIYHDYSTQRVLCMSFEEGRRLSDWIKAQPSREDVDRFARLIINLLIDELLTNGIMQTDPNFGNFLYRPIEGELVLLDFGATNTFSVEFRRVLRQILDRIVAGDFDQVMELTFSQGYLSRQESAETVAYFRALVEKVTWMMQPERQPFRYRNDEWLREVRELATKFALSVRFSAPPHQLFFLNRKLAGMFHLLKDIDAEVEMMEFLNRGLAVKLD